MSHRFHPEALEEWYEAAAYYDQQRRGLGLEFIGAIRDGIHVLANSPDRWPKFTRYSQAYRLKRFPYRIVYAEVGSDDILIVSVMHTKRDSSYIDGRLR